MKGTRNNVPHTDSDTRRELEGMFEEIKRDLLLDTLVYIVGLSRGDEPMDGDATEDLTKEFLKRLDKQEGNI
jgi:hypothetical protein